MLKVYALLSVVSLVLMVWSLIEAVSTDESRIRNLPKLWWILLILFFPLAGSVAWLVAGRPAASPQRRGAAPAFPEYDRPGRAVANDSAKDEDFLTQVRQRAEQQRLRYEQQQRQARETEQREKEQREKEQGAAETE